MTYTAEQLRECPFCGKRPDLDDQDTLYPSGVGWKWDEELQMRTYHRIGDVPRDQWCWVMHCPTNSGGCGAEVHGDSREEAITKWNRRAHADALEENARLTRECEFHAKQCARIDELRHRAEAELAAERERADRNQEDAERYRYLRMHPSVASETLPSSYQRFWCLAELDAAIDAARRK